MSRNFIPSTPYARRLAREMGVDLSCVVPSGLFYEVRARDVLAMQEDWRARYTATPLARRVAGDLGIDLETVAGSGYGGKVRRDDVLAAKEAQSRIGAAGERRERMGGMRRTVSERMSRAHREIPPVTHTVRADVTALLEAREKLRANGAKYSVNDFVLLATARALRSHPALLVSLEGDEIVHRAQVNLGMAVAVDGGLVVPVIREADTLGLATLARTARELAEQARNGKLPPDAFRDSSFTVTNLGMFGVESFTPIINQPNAAILGVCAIIDELALVGGAVCVRKIMRTCLTYDHRLLDGATAAGFQQEITRLLENPIEMVL